MNPTSSTEATNGGAPVGHEDLVAAIDARLAAVDQQLAAFDVLRLERERLFRARRALVGGGAEARLSATTVLAMLAGNPGSTTGELAALLGSGDSAVRAHLHRARQVGRCTARERRWYVTERAAGDADDQRSEAAPDVLSVTAVLSAERDAVEGSAR
ncbi:MAG: hypothetical protein ACSLFR_13525 [Solirubrobacteraceae bacterium]